MFFVQGLLLLLTVMFGSIAGNLSYRILNGAPASITEFPYYAFLSPDGETLRCGGAIIEQSIILTAAHCLVDANFEVYTGIQSLNDLNGRKSYRVKKIIKHPDYSKGSNNDIGLVILSSPIQLSTNAKVIPVADLTPGAGAKATIVGFGKVKCNPFLVDSAGRCFWGDSRNLRYVNATLTGTNDGVIETVSDSNRNTCYGDSGSPVVYQNAVIGVVSAGEKNCVGTDLQTSAVRYRDWIQLYMRTYRLYLF